MKIAMASDHAGLKMCASVSDYISALGENAIIFGTFTEHSVDYPYYAHLVADEVQSKRSDFGILVCGTGIGMSMAANRFSGVRAAVCVNEDMARMTRAHNDANVLCLGQRLIDEDTAKKIVGVFLGTEFEGGRHLNRVKLIEGI